MNTDTSCFGTKNTPKLRPGQFIYLAMQRRSDRDLAVLERLLADVEHFEPTESVRKIQNLEKCRKVFKERESSLMMYAASMAEHNKKRKSFEERSDGAASAAFSQVHDEEEDEVQDEENEEKSHGSNAENDHISEADHTFLAKRAQQEKEGGNSIGCAQQMIVCFGKKRGKLRSTTRNIFSPKEPSFS